MIAEEPIEYYRNLPHFQHIGAAFFVTFRLHDSLPKEVVAKLKAKKEAAIQKEKARKLPQEEEENVIASIKKQYLVEFNESLDFAQTGSLVLKRPEVAKIVIDKFKQYDNQYYYLLAYCVMPNHVHILMDFSAQIYERTDEFAEDKYMQLSRVMQLIKGGSSIEINRLLNQKGTTVWQAENFDTYIRNEKHKEIVINYILNNPVKAGLVKDWEEYPFVGRTGFSPFGR